MAVLFQRIAQGTDPPVHHIRGADDIGAGFGLAEGLFHQRLDSGVIDDFTVDDKPVMAIGIIRVQRHVGHYRDTGHGGLDRAGGTVGQVFWVPGLGTIQRFQRGIGIGEQTNHRDTQIGGLLGGFDDLINTAAHDTRHRGHGLFYAFTVTYKNRPDQIICAERMFAHQSANLCRLAGATKTGGGKSGLCGFHGFTSLGTFPLGGMELNARQG